MPRFDKKNHYVVSNSDFLTEYGHFLDGLGCQAFLDALAAKRVDARPASYLLKTPSLWALTTKPLT